MTYFIWHAQQRAIHTTARCLGCVEELTSLHK